MSPGVVVTTATRSGPSTPLRVASGQWFVVGQAERGATDKAVLLRGMADFDANFGNQVSYGTLYDAIKSFFDEGGSQCYAVRTVGASATKGTLMLQDRAGTPVATLKIDAANPGAWSGNLTVQIQDGQIANTFRITVRLSGTVVEDYNNLASPSAAVLKFANSSYIRVTDQASASVAPQNNPAVLAATALSAGNDQRGSIGTSDYVSSLDVFSPGLGDGAVSIPTAGAAVYTGLVAHCKANNRIAILASTRGASKTDLQSTAQSVNSEYAGLFAPWVLVSDGAGGTKAISPEGYVAACRNRAIQQVGSWKAPAGLIGVANTLIGLDQNFSRTDADSLDDSGVSIVRTINNTIRLYGWRSLSTDTDNYKFLSSRDLLNSLVVQAQSSLEDYVFQPIDGKGQLLSAIQSSLIGIVDPVAQAGGLFALLDPDGKEIDPGYRVVTDESVNSVASLATNTVNALLLVRISPTSAMIALKIVKVAILSGL